MGILNTVWWTTGFLMAAPLVGLGVNNVLAGSYPRGAVFLALGLLVLFLPEYVRWRLFGGVRRSSGSWGPPARSTS